MCCSEKCSDNLWKTQKVLKHLRSSQRLLWTYERKNVLYDKKIMEKEEASALWLTLPRCLRCLRFYSPPPPPGKNYIYIYIYTNIWLLILLFKYHGNEQSFKTFGTALEIAHLLLILHSIYKINSVLELPALRYQRLSIPHCFSLPLPPPSILVCLSYVCLLFVSLTPPLSV